MAKKFKVIEISCAQCKMYVLTYHKYGDGKGIVRLYLKQIQLPKKWNELTQMYKVIGDVPNLMCENCATVIGVTGLSTSKKWIFKMKKGWFRKKITK
jgi:hypothetical protein